MGPISHALLEREAETESIGRQLDQACAGNGSLVVVEGPAGTDKTTLLREAMEMGRERGMRVVYGRGGVLEQQIEYGVVRQMLEEALVGAGDDERNVLLAGPAAPAAAVLGFGEPPARTRNRQAPGGHRHRCQSVREYQRRRDRDGCSFRRLFGNRGRGPGLERRQHDELWSERQQWRRRRFDLLEVHGGSRPGQPADSAAHDESGHSAHAQLL